MLLREVGAAELGFWGVEELMPAGGAGLGPAPLGGGFQHQEPAGKDLAPVLSFFSVAIFAAEAWHLPLAFPDAL